MRKILKLAATPSDFTCEQRRRLIYMEIRASHERGPVTATNTARLEVMLAPVRTADCAKLERMALTMEKAGADFQRIARLLPDGWDDVPFEDFVSRVEGDFAAFTKSMKN